MIEKVVKEKIAGDNFLRLKFLSLVFLGFSLFALAMHYSKVQYWVGQNRDVYVVLDYIFAGITLVSLLFFWFYKTDNIKLKNGFVALITFLVLIWSSVISGVELTSLGFSTYMIVIVAIAFFIYLNLLVSALLYLVSFISFIITLYLFNQLNEASYPFLFSFFPVVIVSHLISRKNFINKITALRQEEKLKALTRELQYSKNNLEEEVKIRTAELVSSETKLKAQNKELVLAKERAKANEIKFSAAFYTSPDSVNINKLNGEYVEINEGFTRLTGYTKEEVIGKISTEIDMWPIPEDRVRLVAGLKKNGIVENLESVFRAKNGTLIPALMSAKIIYLKNEPHILSVTREITERKKMEEDLIKAKEKAEEANRLKTEFLHNMSHEVRTPLNGIMGFSEIIEMPGLSEEKRKNYLKIIRSSSEQLLRIIDDILEISNLETKQLEIQEKTFFLNDLLTEIYSIFNLKAKKQNIPLNLKMEVDKEKSSIKSDKSKLNKILSNLLENALKFTHHGFIELGYYMEKSKLVIYVKDTGIGISAQNQEIIFERFSQEDKDLSRKYGGLGLGLSIAKENAQLLGGNIQLESEKGKGATFFLTIPYKQPKEQQVDIVMPFNNISERKTPTILVAEDEETNYLFLKAIFEELPNFKFNILHAKNGKEAVEICKNNRNIDIVLMDIKMPEIDGFEATKKIKASYPDLPIIAQSAYSMGEEIKKSMEYGFNDYITKPIDTKLLFSIMNKYLNK